jgi:hypothetical protein
MSLDSITEVVRLMQWFHSGRHRIQEKDESMEKLL